MYKQIILATSVLFFLVSVVGCSSNFKSAQTANDYSSQSALTSLLSDDFSFEETEIRVDELVSLNVLKDEIFKNNIPETTRLIVLSKEIGAAQATEAMVNSQPERGAMFTELALRLFHSDRLQIIEHLRLDSTLSESEIIEAALNAKVPANKVVPPTNAGTEYEIVPLINSASIVLFQQPSERTAFVAFKEKDKTDWRIASPLHWEPVRSALSGSIVKLEPNTAYDVRIEIFENGAIVEEKLLHFKTRLNYPPINPKLVFKLSEIYRDGQLDLTKLNIRGDENGWAKIVGDAETPIVAGESDEYAINIGSNSYIIFENVTVKGGRRHGVYSRGAHHLWFKGCDVSNWGRVPTHFHKGKGYESINDIKPINYDAGMLLYKSGVVVVEDCQIHSPNYGSNHWGDSHALHLFDGLIHIQEKLDMNILVYASAGCSPMLDIPIPNNPQCQENNFQVKRIINEYDIDTVLMAGNWAWAYKVKDDEIDLSPVKATVKTLENLGAEVHVVNQLPLYSISNPQFLAMRLAKANYSEPNFMFAPYYGTAAAKQLRRLLKDESLIDAYSLMCPNNNLCSIYKNHSLMVVDNGHLSTAGSIQVAEQLLDHLSNSAQKRFE